MTCAREYFFGMVLHRRSAGRTPALCFGSAWHKALETHYKTGGDEAAVNEAVIMAWEEHGVSDDYRTLDRVLLDYRKYRQQFGTPDKEDEKTLGWPDSPLIEVAANVEGGGLIHPYAGLLDRIIKVNGLVYVQDHKTTSRFDKNFWRQFELSSQMMGYTLIAKLLFPNEKVVGVQVNVAHVLTAKTQFYRQDFTFSPARLEDWVFNTNLQLRRLHNDYKTHQCEMEQHELLAGDPDDAPMPGDGVSEAFPGHFGDNGCSRKYGICGYAPACSVAARIRKATLMQEFEVNEWNPLQANEVEV